MKQSPSSSALIDDADAVLQAFQTHNDEDCFLWASNRLQNDRAFVLGAVQQQAACLRYIGPEFRNDTEIVQAAVQQDGLLLEFASQRLRNDAATASLAIRNDKAAIYLIGESLQRNRDFSLHALETLRVPFSRLPAAAQDDEDVFLAALEISDGLLLRYASWRLRDTTNVVLAAIRRGGGNVLTYVSPRCQRHRAVIMAALHQEGAAVLFCLPSEMNWQHDVELVAHALAGGRHHKRNSLWTSPRYCRIILRSFERALYRVHGALVHEEQRTATTICLSDDDDCKDGQGSPSENVMMGTKAKQVAAAWKTRNYHALWALQQALGAEYKESLVRSVAEYVFDEQVFKAAAELYHLAPLFAACEYHGGWKTFLESLRESSSSNDTWWQ